MSVLRSLDTFDGRQRIVNFAGIGDVWLTSVFLLGDDLYKGIVAVTQAPPFRLHLNYPRIARMWLELFKKRYENAMPSLLGIDPMVLDLDTQIFFGKVKNISDEIVDQIEITGPGRKTTSKIYDRLAIARNAIAEQLRDAGASSESVERLSYPNVPQGKNYKYGNP